MGGNLEYVQGLRSPDEGYAYTLKRNGICPSLNLKFKYINTRE